MNKKTQNVKEVCSSVCIADWFVAAQFSFFMAAMMNVEQNGGAEHKVSATTDCKTFLTQACSL